MIVFYKIINSRARSTQAEEKNSSRSRLLLFFDCLLSSLFMLQHINKLTTKAFLTNIATLFINLSCLELKLSRIYKIVLIFVINIAITVFVISYLQITLFKKQILMLLLNRRLTSLILPYFALKLDCRDRFKSTDLDKRLILIKCDRER